MAANAILEAYYALRKATALDPTRYMPITQLHPFVTVGVSSFDCEELPVLNGLIQICWYLAAVVKVQVCKHMIDSNQLSREIEVWGEINALR